MMITVGRLLHWQDVSYSYYKTSKFNLQIFTIFPYRVVLNLPVIFHKVFLVNWHIG